MCVHTCVLHVHVWHVHVCMCECVGMRVCCVRTHVCDMFIAYARAYVYSCACVVCVHMHKRVHMCVCVYACLHVSKVYMCVMGACVCTPTYACSVKLKDTASASSVWWRRPELETQGPGRISRRQGSGRWSVALVPRGLSGLLTWQHSRCSPASLSQPVHLYFFVLVYESS